MNRNEQNLETVERERANIGVGIIWRNWSSHNVRY